MDGHTETIVQPKMDAPGRKAQRKRKMIPKQRKPDDSLDCLVEDNLKVDLRSAKKPMRHSSHIVLSDFDCHKKTGIRPLSEQNDEDFRLLKSKCPPYVGYKGKKMKITDVIQQVILEVIQRVVKEVAVDIVKDIIDKIVDSAIDSIFDNVANIDGKVKEPDQAKNDFNDNDKPDQAKNDFNDNDKPDQAKNDFNDNRMCEIATTDQENNTPGVSLIK